MSMFITNKDIRNKDGILLLSKNQEVDDDDLKKLRKYGKIDSESSNKLEFESNNSIQKNLSTEIITSFAARKNIFNEHVLEKPNKILNSIIFESRNEPWWININALINYVSRMYTHSIDVAIMSLIIAVELGYGKKQLFDLGLGAILHDIGMLLLPKSIIEKPGPLSETENLIFRQHCELGASSLESYSLPKECTDIVLQHHERLDGSGYPKGLKKDEICLNSEIVMIADTVDKITSNRPDSQDAYPLDEAIKIIKKGEKFSYELIMLLEKALY